MARALKTTAIPWWHLLTDKYWKTSEGSELRSLQRLRLHVNRAHPETQSPSSNTSRTAQRGRTGLSTEKRGRPGLDETRSENSKNRIIRRLYLRRYSNDSV